MFIPELSLLRLKGRQGARQLTATQELAAPGLVEKLARYVRTHYRYRRALWELNQLDDRDLDDLAIGRGDLPALAWHHAQTA